MANANEATTYWNLPNYVGELFLVGEGKTPFLELLGLTLKANGASMGKTAKDFRFPCSANITMENAAQPAITETASLTAPTPWTYVPSQEYNVCQIFQKSVSMSYAKLSGGNYLSGITVHGEPLSMEDQYAKQIEITLKQLALDYEYSALNGTYNEAANAGQANKMRGIITALTTNAVNAASAALSKTLIDNLLRTMVTKAPMKNMVFVCNAFQRQKISEIYGYAPNDRNVGGINIKQVETEFCNISVLFCPNVPTSTLLLADLDYVQPVFLPVPGKGYLFKEILAKSGASETEQIYGQIGIDYGSEAFHGKITSLATS